MKMATERDILRFGNIPVALRMVGPFDERATNSPVRNGIDDLLAKLAAEGVDHIPQFVLFGHNSGFRAPYICTPLEYTDDIVNIDLVAGEMHDRNESISRVFVFSLDTGEEIGSHSKDGWEEEIDWDALADDWDALADDWGNFGVY